MWKYVSTPFNIDLLVLTKDNIKYLGEVKSGRIFIPSTENFDDDGLFSTKIYGQVGSPERKTNFGYIDLKVDIVHPLVFEHIISLKAFYKDILAGKKYAIFNNKIKDFELSNIQDGGTGYHFFFKHFKDIKLVDNDSDQRKFKIDIIKNYMKQGYRFNKLLVIPAGLRDYIVGEDGRAKENEVNDIYRKILGTVQSFENIDIRNEDNMNLISPTLYKLQNAVVELYNYFFNLLNGKSKFTEGKWAKRAVMYGTRNVATPALSKIQDIDDPDKITIDHSIVGLYQYIKAITPITINKVLNKFIYRIMSPDSVSCHLVDKKTLETKVVDINPKKRDDWITAEGLEHTMNKLGQEDIRYLPIEVDGYYLLNIYDDGKVIEPIFNTALIEDEKKKHLRPITYAELLYLAIEDVVDKYPGILTRYPVVNLGGVYPSKVYLRVTNNPRKVIFRMDGIEKELREYPNLKEKFFNSLSPHPIHLARLGGDYDGSISIE